MNVCVNWWGERERGKNGFQIWPRKGDIEVVEGKA
jgi:hypothetical protein